MKNFANWGIRIRKDEKLNYYSIWFNLKTYRLGEGESKELPPTKAEFYDVALGTKCNANCPFCYVSASHGGEFWDNVCELWKAWMDSFPEDIVINPNKLPEDDEVLKDLLTGQPDKKESLDAIGLRIIARAAIKANKQIIYTNKPFQIAIGM